MVKVIAGLLGYSLVVVIGLLVMMFGWGVEPKSWEWIIGGTLATSVVIIMMHAVTSD